MKSKNQALLETIHRLQTRTHQGRGNGPDFFEREGNGRGGEVLEVQSDSEKEETSSENEGQYVFYDVSQTNKITFDN